MSWGSSEQNYGQIKEHSLPQGGEPRQLICPEGMQNDYGLVVSLFQMGILVAIMPSCYAVPALSLYVGDMGERSLVFFAH